MRPSVEVSKKSYPYSETELGVVGTSRRYWIYNKTSLEALGDTLAGAAFQRCRRIEINLDLLKKWRVHESDPATEVPNNESAEYLLLELGRFTEKFPEGSIEGITLYCNGNDELAELLTRGLRTH